MAPKRTFKTETASPLVSIKTIKKSKTYPMKAPFVCPICGDVWQPHVGNEGKDTLHDFPKIGCSLNICMKCELDWTLDV